MADDPAAQTQTDSSQLSDPYVIYQLRKPSQRGTAVIPRFVPNTHAPAFSPANYRFARVWTTNDHAAVSPSSLLHVPRSFEYAGSLGSESSFWSDTSSWVSVSSLRTAPSEVRAPLLHSTQNPVSAASFFNTDLDNTRLRNSFRASSARSSEIDSPIRSDFRYPPALSESISEDAVIDDLLSLHKPQFPHLRNHSNAHTRSRDHANTHRQSSHRSNQSSSRHRSAPAHDNPTRNSLLPTLTHKRRSLWQWLFCTNKAAMSTTVPSVTISQTAAAVRERMRPTSSSTQIPTVNPTTRRVREKTSGNQQSKDRVPKADKEFLDRTQRAPDAPTAQNKTTRRRNPSFEIRRGRPSGATKSGRSMSWNFMPKGLLGRDREPQKEPKEKKKRKSKSKDKPRQLHTEEPKESRKLHRIVFQRSASRKGLNTGKDASRDRKRATLRQTQLPVNTKARNELTRSAHANVDRPREDRPREDRPRGAAKPLSETMTGAGPPFPKSIVPSLREKQSGNTSSQNQRMRSADSSDPVTSRISSDLSTTTYGRTNGSDSSRSTPVYSRQTYRPPTCELDPAANGVSSDVSSHVSVAVGKTSPVANNTDPRQEYSALSSPDIRGVDPATMSRYSPHRAPLFAFQSTSSGSGGFSEAQSKTAVWEASPNDYPEYSNAFKAFGSTAPELIATMDPVARAKEKNRARSVGGPLSYLMKQHDAEGDVNTQSTGLTSLADESVSTHKTISVAGDEYQYKSQLPGGLHRRMYGETYKSSTAQEAHENRSSGTTGASRPIFQNYAMHPNRARSPSHASSGASPRRFHSDWSDPHATDIDVYCQCNCSCVYEEECRRSCDLIYGRSPSVSSTRSRHGHQGFKTLPPAIPLNGRQSKTSSTDLYDNTEREPSAVQNGLGSGSGHSQPSQKTYLRAYAVDELPDPGSERLYSQAYTPFTPRQEGSANAQDNFSDMGRAPRTGGQQEHANGNRRPSYGRESSLNNPKQNSIPTYRQRRSLRPHKDSDGNRAPTPRVRTEKDQMVKKTDGRHRHRPRSHGDGSGLKDSTRRSSSRRSGQNGSSHSSSRPSGRQERPRGEFKTDKSPKTWTDRKRKDGPARLGQDREGSRSEGGQQMGNSYVVKRSGPPPLSQGYMPQPYSAVGYDAGVSHDYPEDGGLKGGYGDYGYEKGRIGEYEHGGGKSRVDMFGNTPLVELEYEKRGGSGKSGYKKETRQEDITQEELKERSKSQHGHKRQHASRREGETEAKSRQTRKSNSRSRTPVFGMFQRVQDGGPTRRR